MKDGMLEPAYKVRFGDKSMPPIEYVKEKGRGGRDLSGDLFRSGYVNFFWVAGDRTDPACDLYVR